jgi:hypothetical protein
VSTTTDLVTAGGVWTVEAPDGVTVAPPASAGEPLKITIDYQPETIFGGVSHGIIDLKFTEPAGGPPGSTDNFGLRYDYIFEFKNSLGVPVEGFVLYNADETSVVDPDIGPGGHPQKYAHFHGVTETTFPSLTSKVLLQDFVTSADFAGPSATLKAPGQIQATGTIANGAMVTGSPIVLHQWDQAGVVDNFHIAFFPLLDSGQILLAAAPGEISQNEGSGTDTTYTFTILRSGDGSAIDTTTTTVQYDIVGLGEHPTDGVDFTGGVAPQGTVTFAPDETSKTISFTVAGDALLEENETFRVELSNSSGSAVIVNPGDATGTIVNDDVTPASTIKTLTTGNDFWPGPAFPGDTNSGNEIINGLAGNDTISGGTGDDTINGGSGFDTALWSGYRLQNNIALSFETDSSVSGAEGNDTLRNVERYVFTDGEFITDTTHAAAQVYRLYGAALDRTPDQNGLKAWTAALTSGTSDLVQVAEGFTQSPEFQSKYGGNLTDGQYITLLYQNVLDREPDAAGLAAWEGALKSGLSRAEALVGFSDSPENLQKTSAAIGAGLWLRDDQTASIARLYDSVLDRLPDAAGLSAWKAGLQGGMTLQQAADGFTNSPEFTSKYGNLDNMGFVEQLYLNVLDREGEESGVKVWTDGLNAGLSRAEVVLGFSEAEEHQIKLASQIDDGVWLL